jgi:FKBP-type peptidyl-prolyl cis-trans isomerase
MLVASARRLAGVSCAVAVLLLAGCGGDSAPVSSIAEAPAPPTLSPAQQRRADARAARRQRIQLERTFAPNPWKEPAASAAHPHGVPKHLIVREVERGSGPAVRGDENVYADFVKTYWRSGRKFLVAWGPLRAEYLSLSGQAAGIRRGMIGMRPGGRRTIVMPRAIGDVHDPDGTGWEIAHVDIVLRKTLPTG